MSIHELIPFASETEPVFIIVALVVFVIFLVLSIFFLNFGSIWIQGVTSGVKVGPVELLAMWLRKVPPRPIVESMIMIKKCGLSNRTISCDLLQAQHLAGGNVTLVVRAMIAAKNADIELDYSSACAIDLSGQDVLEEVKSWVERKNETVENPDVNTN